MEFTIDQFIRTYNIRPADALKMKKKSFGMLDHYVIYLGVRDYQHKFVANYTKGVAIIPDHEIVGFLQMLQTSAIEPFPGTDYQRQFALERAYSRVGQNSYGLISNNCEHFKNYVHYGKDISRQAESFGGTIAAGGIATAIAGIGKKDAGLTCVGILAALLGAAIYQKENKSENDNGFQPYVLQ